jgi:hypothetical protein
MMMKDNWWEDQDQNDSWIQKRQEEEQQQLDKAMDNPIHIDKKPQVCDLKSLRK